MAGGLGGRPFPGRGRGAGGLRRRGGVPRALGGRGSGAGRREGAGAERPARPWWEGAAGGGLKMALTGGPTCQRRVGGEREMVGWRGEWAGWFGPCGLSGGLGC
jgi:hypothetical protein